LFRKYRKKFLENTIKAIHLGKTNSKKKVKVKNKEIKEKTLQL